MKFNLDPDLLLSTKEIKFNLYHDLLLFVKENFKGIDIDSTFNEISSPGIFEEFVHNESVTIPKRINIVISSGSVGRSEIEKRMNCVHKILTGKNIIILVTGE